MQTQPLAHGGPARWTTWGWALQDVRQVAQGQAGTATFAGLQHRTSWEA